MAALQTSTPAPSALRLRMESAIESMMAACDRLVAELDTMDPDPDLEDSGDDEHSGDLEPSLGSIDCGEGSQRKWASGDTRDMEHEHDGREPGGDHEHTLGRSEAIDQTLPDYPSDDLEYDHGGTGGTADQRHWAAGEHGLEGDDNPDREPSLGSINRLDQTSWGASNDQDLEDQCEDEGAHDEREPDGAEANVPVWSGHATDGLMRPFAGDPVTYG